MFILPSTYLKKLFPSNNILIYISKYYCLQSKNASADGVAFGHFLRIGRIVRGELPSRSRCTLFDGRAAPTPGRWWAERYAGHPGIKALIHSVLPKSLLDVRHNRGLFSLPRANACEHTHSLAKTLECCLCTLGMLPTRAIDSLATMQALFAHVPALLLDATEYRCRRLQAVVDRPAEYSGKKSLPLTTCPSPTWLATSTPLGRPPTGPPKAISC